MPQARPVPTSSPVALFVFSNLREQKGGLTRAWLRRLSLFHEAGWETHVATIHLQPEIDETLAAWRERGWLPQSTSVHHYQRRSRRLRTSWSRPTDDHFTRDDRVADWLDWLVGLLPGAVVFADSPVTYAPVAKMRNPYVGRIMTVHLVHRTPPKAAPGARKALPARSRYQGPAGQPKLTGRFLPYADQADAVVALTRRQAQHLTQDVPGLSVHVIPNIVDPPDADLTGIRRDPLRVVSIGRLDPLKRVDDAMRAVVMARAQVPGLHLEVFGRGPDLDRLVALRDDLGAQDIVSFPGFTEAPYAELAGARASVMTSRREGFGLSVAESLAVGTPVVTYDVDYGPAELVTDGMNGRVVPDGAVEQLAAALADVVTDDRAWSSLSEAGPPAVAHLAADRVAATWLDLAAKVAAAVPLPEPGLLVEDVRVRRNGMRLVGVGFGAAGREPVQVRVGATAIALEPSGELPDITAQADQAPQRRGQDITAMTATLPWPQLARIVTQAASEGTGAVLTAVDSTSGSLPAHGPGVPATVLPTEAGLAAVQLRSDGALELTAIGQVLPLRATPTRVEADFAGDVTGLAELILFEADVERSRTPRLRVRCVAAGLDLQPGSELSVVARTDPPRVVGTAALTPGAVLTGGSDRWQGTATVTWLAEALLDPPFTGPARLDLGIAVGRSLRSVGSIHGPGRPTSVRLPGGPWVMATSSTGRLMLLPGRGIRARVAWTVRKARRATT